ncbi:MAG: hypothetical protein OXH05_01680 [Acidobacteria bacterium]|nr:hypothetical protein [Acidobacteriota bacterium]
MNEKQLFRLMQRFERGVVEATSALIYTLYGVNLVHRRSEGMPPSSFPTPDYPPLRVVPYVTDNQPFSRRVAPGGPVEQFVLKAWVVEVYSIWEDDYRSKLVPLFQQLTSRAIRPESDVLGDLGYIRGDLVHHKAVAKKCARCKVLKWFSRGERMHLSMHHVLDFLNQMGWIRDGCTVVDDRVVLWLPPREQRMASETVPRLASVRPMVDDELPCRFGMTVVFEDGVFANVPIEADGSLPSDEQWNNIVIDASGDLRVPNGAVISAAALYGHCFGPTRKGPGPYSTPFRFAR